MLFHIKLYYNQFKKWLHETFTKKGRQQKFLRSAMVEMDFNQKQRKTITKAKVKLTAGRMLEQKKIVGFNGSKSIHKTKTNKHKLKTVVEGIHQDDLKKSNLQIKKGTLAIKDA